MHNLDASMYFDRLKRVPPVPVVFRGFVREVAGLIVKARMPNARIGDCCNIQSAQTGASSLAEVVGFHDEDVFLTPYDTLFAIGPRTPVINQGGSLQVAVGMSLLGRVVDSLGEPIDGLGALDTSVFYPVKQRAPAPMSRKRITALLPVGIKAIDSLLTVGEGQRVGVFSVAGVGKSSLLGMIARNSRADVNVVALVGERGREVKDFLEDNLGDGLGRSVVVVSTSDEVPMRRVMAAYTATAIAEYFRDQGLRVMLFVDSITRFARALREIALSIGEPPVRSGYPPSVFATLPQLLERAGNTATGSITAFYTILLGTESVEDALGEEIRAILDGHLVLSSRLSQAQHYPAIDILASNSRLMNNLINPEHQRLAERFKQFWAVYEDNRDLISIGAYRKGSDEMIDEAIMRHKDLSQFLIQQPHESVSFATLINELAKACGMNS